MILRARNFPFFDSPTNVVDSILDFLDLNECVFFSYTCNAMFLKCFKQSDVLVTESTHQYLASQKIGLSSDKYQQKKHSNNSYGKQRTQKLMEVLFTASMPFLTLAVVHSTLTYMVKFRKDQHAIFINTWKGLSEDDPLTDDDLDAFVAGPVVHADFCLN